MSCYCLWGLGFGAYRVYDSGFCVKAGGIRVLDLGQESGFWVCAKGLAIQGFGSHL